MPTENVKTFCQFHVLYMERQKAIQMYLNMFADNGFAVAIPKGYKVRRVFPAKLPKGSKLSKRLTWVVRSSRKSMFIRIDHRNYRKHSNSFDFPAYHPMHAPSLKLKNAIRESNVYVDEIRANIKVIKTQYPKKGIYEREVMVLRQPVDESLYKNHKFKTTVFKLQGGTEIEQYTEEVPIIARHNMEDEY